jgi:hypothetical protein
MNPTLCTEAVKSAGGSGFEPATAKDLVWLRQPLPRVWLGAYHSVGLRGVTLVC